MTGHHEKKANGDPDIIISQLSDRDTQCHGPMTRAVAVHWVKSMVAFILKGGECDYASPNHPLVPFDGGGCKFISC